MLGLAKKIPGRLQAVERMEEWTRERFGLPKEAAISVAEVACTLPGCAPIETVVMFWIAEQRYQFKLAEGRARGARGGRVGVLLRPSHR